MRAIVLGGILAAGFAAGAPAQADAAVTAPVHVTASAGSAEIVPAQYIWRGRPYRYRWHGGYYAYQWHGGYYRHRRWFHHGWQYY